MKKTSIMTVALLILASGFATYLTRAQQTGIKRADLQRHDLSVPGREVIQSRLDFVPGALTAQT